MIASLFAANSPGLIRAEACNEWELLYKEDPTGPANSKNLFRVGD